jgi:predicted ABC-class ATPase
MLLSAVPDLVHRNLCAEAHDLQEMERWAATTEDADAIRAALPDAGLVAFVGDGSSLPRRTGVDDRPLEGSEVVLFTSPESLRVELETPNAGRVTGMGVRRGVTLIVGGGFHGKSTLLRALEFGVYNHRPGDGRERVVTVPDAVKVRAEDGRSVAGVDISGFIDNLPLAQDTRAFSTPNASGSTSQAAAIVEALEAGAGALLVDEDTSATNFMIRDRRMQELVPKEGEPITPFIDRVRELFKAHGISSLLVLGGSGDYLDVADTVIVLREYRAEEITARARAVAESHPTGRASEEAPPFVRPAPRTPDPASVDPRRGRRDVSVKVPDPRKLLFGEEEVDLSAVEQLVARGQVTAVGQALALARRDLMRAGATVPDVLAAVEDVVAKHGLDALDARRPGDLAGFRRFELAAALNRLRSLRVV